jgi:hypothetical protein
MMNSKKLNRLFIIFLDLVIQKKRALNARFKSFLYDAQLQLLASTPDTFLPLR